jgi:cyclophilin family peptidyl-prolyl cis-trans isomerase
MSSVAGSALVIYTYPHISPPCNLPPFDAVFGHVIDGLDTLDRMEKVPGDAKDRPKQEMKLDRVTIHANPLAP